MSRHVLATASALAPQAGVSSRATLAVSASVPNISKATSTTSPSLGQRRRTKPRLPLLPHEVRYSARCLADAWSAFRSAGGAPRYALDPGGAAEYPQARMTELVAALSLGCPGQRSGQQMPLRGSVAISAGYRERKAKGHAKG